MLQNQDFKCMRGKAAQLRVWLLGWLQRCTLEPMHSLRLRGSGHPLRTDGTLGEQSGEQRSGAAMNTDLLPVYLSHECLKASPAAGKPTLPRLNQRASCCSVAVGIGLQFNST